MALQCLFDSVSDAPQHRSGMGSPALRCSPPSPGKGGNGCEIHGSASHWRDAIYGNDADTWWQRGVEDVAHIGDGAICDLLRLIFFPLKVVFFSNFIFLAGSCSAFCLS